LVVPWENYKIWMGWLQYFWPTEVGPHTYCKPRVIGSFSKMTVYSVLDYVIISSSN